MLPAPASGLDLLAGALLEAAHAAAEVQTQQQRPAPAATPLTGLPALQAAHAQQGNFPAGNNIAPDDWPQRPQQPKQPTPAQPAAGLPAAPAAPAPAADAGAVTVKLEAGTYQFKPVVGRPTGSASEHPYQAPTQQQQQQQQQQQLQLIGLPGQLTARPAGAMGSAHAVPAAKQQQQQLFAGLLPALPSAHDEGFYSERSSRDSDGAPAAAVAAAMAAATAVAGHLEGSPSYRAAPAAAAAAVEDADSYHSDTETDHSSIEGEGDGDEDNMSNKQERSAHAQQSDQHLLGAWPAQHQQHQQQQQQPVSAMERAVVPYADALAAASAAVAAAPQSAPDSGLISALAAIFRQQEQQQQLAAGAPPAPFLQVTTAAPSAPPVAAAAAGAAAGGVSPAQVSLQATRSASQPLTSPADLLQLLLGLVRTTGPAGAEPPVGDLVAPPSDPIAPKQQQQQQVGPPVRHAPGAAFGTKAEPSPNAVAALACLTSPAGIAAPRVAAAAAGTASAQTAPAGAVAAHVLMKRKASSSLPNSPGMQSPGGHGAGGHPGGGAGGGDNIGTALQQLLRMQVPPHPHGCFSSGAYSAPAPAVGAAAAVSNAAAASGVRVNAGRNTATGVGALQEPRAWMGGAVAGVGGYNARGFPTRATPEPDPEEEPIEKSANHLPQGASAVCQSAATAAGGVSISSGKGRAEVLQADAAEGVDGMEVDVSPSMAAAAAAMAGLAGLSCNSSGNGSTAGTAAVEPSAAAAAGGSAGGKKSVRSRKFMRFDDDGSGGGSGGDVPSLWYQQQQQQQQSAGASRASKGSADHPTHQDPSAAEAAAAAAAMAAVATAGMLAGSLNWGQQWYGCNNSNMWGQASSSMAAAAAAAAGGGGGGGGGGMLPMDSSAAPTAAAAAGRGGGYSEDAAGGFSWDPHSMSGEQGSWHLGSQGMLEGYPLGMVPWLPQLAAQQQQQEYQVPRPRSRSASGKAGGPKPRAPRAKKDPPDAAAEAAAGVNGSLGPAPRPGVTAAGKKGPRGGGGKSSTSHFRGVTQHRYTLRWEAHLWDPDAVRCKTAGSSRTKGRQTYLGGYSCETEAARAYDRAALVYWGNKGFTNFPKEDYAGEMHLLTALQREGVVANLRAISHAMQKWVPRYEGVMPHQALPGVFEARLYEGLPQGAPNRTYQYLGAYPSEEAAYAAVAQAMQVRQQVYAAAQEAMMADARLAAAAAAAAMPVA